MKDITEIVGNIVSSLTFQFECLAVIPISGGFELTTTNTYWLRPDKLITISGSEYKIISIVINDRITVKPISHLNTPTTGLIFNIPLPTYRHGTAIAINAELSTIKQNDKTPFVWLYETFEETRNYNDEDNVGLTANVRLFLFDESNAGSIITEKHYSDVIRPLKQLAEEIVGFINANPVLYQEVETASITGLPDWGEFNEMRGFEGKIFDENWSGIEIRFELNVNKENCLDNI